MTVPRPYVVAGGLAGGLALAAVVRVAVAPALLLVVLAAAGLARSPAVAVACLLAVGGWWWGSVRLAALDHSVLSPRVGTAERALVDVAEPPRSGRFEVRVRAVVRRWGRLRVHEPVLLELAAGRAPPQGARLAVLGVLRPPRGPSNGFDERAWLARHGVHVVLRADRWRIVGRRGGLGGVADALHRWLARASVPGLRGERRAVLEGVVLGEDQGLSDALRARFRASGLYHLLAVSGGNVIVVAAGTVGLALLLGISRLAGEAAALVSIAAYTLAVGPQPSVIRASIAGALASLAILAGRRRDSWYALLLGAILLLAWNPENVLDPGFQLSFAAVVSIFTLAPRIRSRLDELPLQLPERLVQPVAVSAACGLGTAPVSYWQFHAVPLLTVPANAAAAPAVVPMLGLALVAALVDPVAPSLASALAQLNGWCAAYLAACARFFGGLPGAQIRSPAAAAALAAGVLLVAAYAWRRDDGAQARLSGTRLRPPEDRARSSPAAGTRR